MVRSWRGVLGGMDVQAEAWDFLRARELVEDGDAATASGARFSAAPARARRHRLFPESDLLA